MTVTELTSTTDCKQAYPLMSELVGHLNEKEYVALLTEMRKEGYRLFGFTHEGNSITSRRLDPNRFFQRQTPLGP